MTTAPPAAWADRAEAGLAGEWANRRQRRAWQRDPLAWLDDRDIEVRGAARDLIGSTDQEVVLAGPAGTGKSVAALSRIHHAALNYPGSRHLILRKTAKTLGSTTLRTFEERVAAAEIAKHETNWYGGSVREPASYRYTNGSSVVVGGMDDPGKIMSSDYDLIFADEMTELTIADWDAANTRLRHGVMPYQQLLGACNPSHPKHWARERSIDGPLRMLHSRHVDNPAYAYEDGSFTPAGATYLARLANLTGVRRHRLLDGVWAAAEGVIYGDFDEAVHLVDPFKVPPGWTRYWSVDFGYMNAFTCGFWAEDPDGRLYLYREIYHSQRIVEDHAKEILSIVAPGGQWIEPKPRFIVCDHDSEDRVTLERHVKLPTRPAKKNVKPGIEAVKMRLRPAGDGRARLFLMRGALVERDQLLAETGKPLCLQDEIPGYVWASGPDGKPVKEEPSKIYDHGVDEMRYMVAELDLRGGVATISRPTGALGRR